MWCCSEYCNWRVSAGGVEWRARRLSASCAVLCARAGLPPPPPPAPRPPHALSALHELVLAASTDDPALGRSVHSRRHSASLLPTRFTLVTSYRSYDYI